MEENALPNVELPEVIAEDRLGLINVEEQSDIIRPTVIQTCMTLDEFRNHYYVENNLTKKENIKWNIGHFITGKHNFYEPEVDEFQTLPTPTDFFIEYFTPQLIEEIAFCTNHYAVLKNVANFPPTNPTEIRTFIGINLMMGIIGYPRVRMYWEPRFRIPIIAESGINVNRFYKLRNNLHIVNVLEKPKDTTDKFWLVRPLYDSIRNRCLQLKLETKLSIDEQIIPFKGRSEAKQFNKNKPSKWGIKLFVICGASGMMYDFIMYQGSTTVFKPEYELFGLGAAVVMQLSERAEPGCQLYFDNFFSTYSLFQWLLSKNLYAIGTVRLDRFQKPPLIDNKEMTNLKLNPRGSADEVMSEDGIVLTKWADNSCVTMGSNFMGSGKVDTCLRWDKNARSKVVVPQPEVVKLYNKSMGGVDNLDFLIAIYRTFIRSRKWTLRLFTHGIDLSITNSWFEYRKCCHALGIPKKDILDLIHFRGYVAETFIIRGSTTHKKRGRPSGDGPSPKIHPKRAACVTPVEDIRFDKVDHWPEYSEKKHQDRCKNEGCKKKTYIYCGKCRIPLCIQRESNCFRNFHSK